MKTTEQSVEDYDEQQRLACRNASKSGWLKVFFEYERGIYDVGTEMVIINVKNTNMNTIKNKIKEYFGDWSGKGGCTLSSIETGPFRENQLSAAQYSSFADKTYKFNN